LGSRTHAPHSPAAIPIEGNRIELTAADQRLPIGASFAARRQEQLTALHEAELGAGPMHKRLGEETPAALPESHKGYWASGARVKHLISARRLGREYIADCHRALGESRACLSQRDGANIPGASIPAGGGRIKGMPSWLMRRAALAWVKTHNARLDVASDTCLKPWVFPVSCRRAQPLK